MGLGFDSVGDTNLAVSMISSTSSNFSGTPSEEASLHAEKVKDQKVTHLEL